ncbi:hypothetical protein [Mycolicibacterium sphagni]|uniref:hypothetical protein n=1 Tax=Mycolicibacterium sphagni TaxID=1786 RepID=UPI0021F2CC26|nr:hypothetical protein [Mycolicibacterium sphagni]MCV7174887.1 hypothetical protein [Mycolicibacterium sphagni]
MKWWIAAFSVFAFATIVAATVADEVGVGDTWPFAVIVPLLVAEAATGTMAFVKVMRRGT